GCSGLVCDSSAGLHDCLLPLGDASAGPSCLSHLSVCSTRAGALRTAFPAAMDAAAALPDRGRRMRFALSALAFGVVLLTAAVPGLTTDVEAGKTAFKKCALCHSTDAAKSNKIGPSLFGVVGRKSASLDNFSYSEGLQKF